MFTGRISEVGTIVDVAQDSICVAAPKTSARIGAGSSVAVSGACLTVTSVEDESFVVTLSSETRHRSMLGEQPSGAEVNLELPLSVGDRLEGHLVQGHVDAVGKIVRVDDEAPGVRLWVRPPERFLDDVIAKGSIALDGVSLTVAEVARDRFSVALVPVTLAETNLGRVSNGQRVNLESDLVSRLARRHAKAAGSSLAAVVGALPWAGRLSGRVAVDKVVAQLAAGGAVVVWDPVREGEADVVFSGGRVRPEAVRFVLTEACGHMTVPCGLELLDRLGIPPLPGAGDRHGTAPHLPVDLAAATGTGVSAQERSATIRRLAHHEAVASDFVRPGHVLPLGGRRGGLSERLGHTEASLALCEAAGLPPVAVICEIMAPDGTMASASEAERFALRWSLPLVEIEDLCTWL